MSNHVAIQLRYKLNTIAKLRARIAELEAEAVGFSLLAKTLEDHNERHEKRIAELEAAKDKLLNRTYALEGDIAELEAENTELRHALTDARAIINEQAEDEGLWFVAETAAEAYLQQELRKLHAALEDGK